MDNLASGDRRPHARRFETPAFLISVGLCVVCLGYWLLLTKVYHFSNEQAAELAAYVLSALTFPVARPALCNAPVPARKTEGPSAARHESRP